MMMSCVNEWYLTQLWPHKHILRVYDTVFQSDGYFMFATEWVFHNRESYDDDDDYDHDDDDDVDDDNVEDAVCGA